MDTFLGCDWGTSSLRLRLVDTTNLKIICEENTTQGIADTFAVWNSPGEKDPSRKTSFYLSVIDTSIQQMETRLGHSLDGVPVIISGMASSSIGMLERPYALLPFALDGSGAGTYYFGPSHGFDHPVLLISGVKSDDDVMRGEETQLVGCADIMEKTNGGHLFIFPGTHSKHVTVIDNYATAIKTFMTGEFFALLSGQSILRTSVERHDDFQDTSYINSFSKGVIDAKEANLLNVSFRVRTNDLLSKLNPKENYSYLGGLLIGSELKEILQPGIKVVYVCGGATLAARYKQAIEVLKPAATVHILPADTADEATIKGQYKIFHHYKSKL